MLYELIKFAGLIIRQFFLPNPFEAMWPEYATVLNWIAGILLMPVAYFITGLWYKRGDGAAVGSFVFNVTYIGLTLLLWGILEAIKIISDNLVVATIITVIVLIMVIVVSLLFNRIKKKKTISQE